jgi:hypothetical protein
MDSFMQVDLFLGIYVSNIINEINHFTVANTMLWRCPEYQKGRRSSKSPRFIAW